MADQAGPGKGDGSADTGPSVRFSTQPTTDSTDSQQRPGLNQRVTTESPLPPHQRQGVNTIPVTPGIALRTYEAESSLNGPESAGGGYFSQHPAGGDATTPDPLDDEMAAQSPEEGAHADHDILERMNQSRHGRRATVGDVKSAYPSLPISGNIISATFNMPHSLKYRKGADWVSAQIGDRVR